MSLYAQCMSTPSVPGQPSKASRLNLNAVRNATDAGSFRHGLVYYREHRVHDLERVAQDRLAWTATVRGTRPYRVTVQVVADGRLEGVCQCPAYRDWHTWCKHLVAAALAAATGEEEPRASAPGPAPTVPSPSPFVAPSSAAPVVLPRSYAPAPVDAVPLAPPAPAAGGSHPARVVPPRPPNALPGTRASDFLALFDQPRPRTATREILRVEFTVTVTLPGPSYREQIGVSLRLGPKRLYVVPNMTPTLDAIAHRRRHEFTARFAYDPDLHDFRPEDAAVLAVLGEMAALRKASGSVTPYPPYRTYSYGYGQERIFGIAPEGAGRLWPLLEAAGASLDTSGRPQDPSAVPFRVLASPLPLQAALGPDDTGRYVLSIDGLGRVRLLPSYGIAAVLDAGTLHHLEPADAILLHRLQDLGPSRAGGVRVTLAPDELEASMLRVVPRLRRLCDVVVAAAVAERVVEAPLTARVYVDREDDALTVRIEWHYGDAVLGRTGAGQGGEAGARIVVRDPEGERRVLDLVDDGVSEWQGDVLHIEHDDAVYHFLHDVLGALQEAAEVYVTDAVRALWAGDRMRPRVRVDLDVDSHWLDVSFDLEGIDAAEVDAVLRSLVERRRYHRLRSGALVDLATPAFEEAAQMAADLGLGSGAFAGGSARVPAWRGAVLDEAAGGGDALRLGRSLRRWLRGLRHPEELDLEPPGALRGVLRDYQERGYQWLMALARYGFGGILADDMGLGKTIEAIAFLLAERQVGPFAEPALVVCPASLVYNWESEIHQFAPTLRVAVVAGTAAEREAVLAHAAEADVLVTSYPLVLRDIEHYRGRRLHALLLDEAQFVKNHESKTARAIVELESDRRFALTGTPIENSLDDLWSILRAVFPDLAGSRESFNRLAPDQVARRVRPFLLRRRKADVLSELPEKIETVASAALTPEQKRIYLAYLERIQRDAERQIDSEGFQRSRIKILAGLTRLRQICCHPGLFVEDYAGGSGKLDLLLDLLTEAMEGGRHVLVFSQFTSMLSLIASALGERGWPYFYLDGATPTGDRLALTQAFNRGERPIFLISLKAGGTGLNLTGADTVILYDLWWNPAVEQQAADRAHRIGQRNVVQVIRLIARGTIEEHIHRLQEAKRDLVEAVVADSDQGLGALGEAEVRELLALPARAAAGAD